jgi:hypothetical protein
VDLFVLSCLYKLLYELTVDSRMADGEITLPTTNPKLDVKVSLHPAFQCMVIGY